MAAEYLLMTGKPIRAPDRFDNSLLQWKVRTGSGLGSDHFPKRGHKRATTIGSETSLRPGFLRGRSLQKAGGHCPDAIASTAAATLPVFVHMGRAPWREGVF